MLFFNKKHPRFFLGVLSFFFIRGLWKVRTRQAGNKTMTGHQMTYKIRSIDRVGSRQHKSSWGKSPGFFLGSKKYQDQNAKKGGKNTRKRWKTTTCPLRPKPKKHILLDSFQFLRFFFRKEPELLQPSPPSEKRTKQTNIQVKKTKGSLHCPLLGGIKQYKSLWQFWEISLITIQCILFKGW